MDQFNKMLARWEPMVLSIFRIMVGLLLFQYGVAKILKFPVLPYFANIPPLITAAGWIELVLGALLVLGLFTRPVAFILSGEMAVAYFLAHAPHGFFPIVNMGELAVIYCFAFLYLSAAGPGPWSVDAMRAK